MFIRGGGGVPGPMLLGEGGDLPDRDPQTESPWVVIPMDRYPCIVKSGRYAYYWNAFLFMVRLVGNVVGLCRYIYFPIHKPPVVNVQEVWPYL